MSRVQGPSGYDNRRRPDGPPARRTWTPIVTQTGMANTSATPDQSLSFTFAPTITKPAQTSANDKATVVSSGPTNRHEKAKNTTAVPSTPSSGTKSRYFDSHCHVDMVAKASGFFTSRTPGPQSPSPWISFLEKTPMPEEYIGCLALFCLVSEPSWGRWDDYLVADPCVWGAVGIHPHEARRFTPKVRDQIIESMAHPRVVAWGECGLDYYRLFNSRAIQMRSFTEQVQCAVRCNKPIVIHCRDKLGSTAATTDCYAILKQWMPADWRVHFHCWSQTAAETEEAMRLFPNAYFGFTGLVTTNRPGVRDAVGVVPLDRILLETDGPFCAPVVNGKRPPVCHPGHIPYTAQWIARRKNVSLAVLYEHTLRNSERMYGISLQ